MQIEAILDKNGWREAVETDGHKSKVVVSEGHLGSVLLVTG
jgi:hypothetical protein